MPKATRYQGLFLSPVKKLWLLAFLEVKSAKGHTTDAQDDCLGMLQRMGHDVAVVRSQDDAVLILQEWGWPVR